MLHHRPTYCIHSNVFISNKVFDSATSSSNWVQPMCPSATHYPWLSRSCGCSLVCFVCCLLLWMINPRYFTTTSGYSHSLSASLSFTFLFSIAPGVCHNHVAHRLKVSLGPKAILIFLFFFLFFFLFIFFFLITFTYIICDIEVDWLYIIRFFFHFLTNISGK